MRPPRLFVHARLAVRGVVLAAIATGVVSGCEPPSGDGRNAGDATSARPGRRRHPDAPGHRRMVALLSEIAQNTPHEHPYLGNNRLGELKERLAAAGESASHEVRFRLEVGIGEAELRLGNLRASIDHFRRAYELTAAAKISAADANYTRYRLGVAYMRLGETRNCCLRNTPDSCIVPIRDGGRHRDAEGSENAIRYFTEILDSI